MTAPALVGIWAGQDVVVLTAANSWDETRMADRQLAVALSAHAPVLYVDPALSVVARARMHGLRGARVGGHVRQVADRVVRLSPEGLPAGSKRGVADVNRAVVAHQVRQALRTTGGTVRAQLEANVQAPTMGRVPAGNRVYWAQDDFVAMGPLVGVSPRLLARGERRLAAAADAIIAANPTVAGSLEAPGRAIHLIPFGCDAGLFGGPPPAPDPAVDLPHPIAFLMGTLNDRLDVACLRAVVEAGVSLLLVGPRSGRFASPAFDALLARPDVQWTGPRAFEDLPALLAHADVGIVPYTHSPFNEGSFPLKTLEYLAAGLPVVATDLPAIRWLASPHVEVADRAADFGRTVARRASQPRDTEAACLRRRFAAGHSWQHRAVEFAEVLGL
ncbi:glycosyltransferase [Nocardioides sp. LS1]|uniref:glycosyltransferase n=1 Tax=Nocardioides sp. LS1 TaxID=1027620 RepID=UPI000F623280|nr:glycosyltransferase [Nocardioides sp. LS1]